MRASRWVMSAALAAMTGASAIAWVPPLIGVSAAAGPTAPPWEPDANAAAPYGNLTFYNSAGTKVTSGSDLSSPFAYAVASTGFDAGATNASLTFDNPTFGSPPATWTGTDEAGPTTFNPTSGLPVGTPADIVSAAATNAVVVASEASVTDWLGSNTPATQTGYADTIQVRLVDSGPRGAGNAPGTYWESDIGYNTTSSAIVVDGTFVPADGWAQLYPLVAPAVTVTKFSPATLTRGASGVKVSVTGTGFVSGAKLTVSGVTVSTVSVVNSTSITATASVAATTRLGAATVSVTDSAGAASCSTCLSIVLPAQGYYLVGKLGKVLAAGGVPALPGFSASASDPAVGIASTADGQGYVAVTADGAVYVHGDATFHGDLPDDHIHPNKPVVAIAETADDGGYWLLAADGGFFAFGDAKYRGSVPGLHESVSDVVAMEADPFGIGYWMAAADGTVWNFGSAGFFKDLPVLHVKPNLPVVGMLPSATGQGYVLIASDGGAFKFGHGVDFYGSLPGRGVRVSDVVGLALTPDDGGYWMAGSNGDVYAGFGDAKAFGSPAGLAAALPIVGIGGP
jgi:hypothetical protein